MIARCALLADVRVNVAHLARRLEAGEQDFLNPWNIEALLRSPA